MVLWELGREGDNGDGEEECVILFSIAFTATGGCNNAVVPLGCNEQAKAVCFYLLKHITKDSTALENTRVLVREAMHHVSKYPSNADDTGNIDRTTKHLLQRVVNTIAGAQEMSAQMAATALIGKPSCFTSDSFWFAYIWPAIKEINSRKGELSKDYDASRIDMDKLEIPIDEGHSIVIDTDVELLPGGTHGTLHDDEQGAASVFRVFDEHGKKSHAILAQHTHYKHRGQALQILSFYEFVSLISITPMSASDREALAQKKAARNDIQQTSAKR
jgi:hypothetical protein